MIGLIICHCTLWERRLLGILHIVMRCVHLYIEMMLKSEQVSNVYISLYKSISIIYPFVFLFVCLSVCLSVHLCVCLFVSLSLCLSVCWSRFLELPLQYVFSTFQTCAPRGAFQRSVNNKGMGFSQTTISGSQLFY